MHENQRSAKRSASPEKHATELDRVLTAISEIIQQGKTPESITQISTHPEFQKIMQVLHHINQVMSSLARGNLQSALEFQHLVPATFQALLENLDQLCQESSQIAEGKLEQRTCSIREIAIPINKMAATLNAARGQLRSARSELYETKKRSYQETEKHKQALEHQKESIQALKSRLAEQSKTVHESQELTDAILSSISDALTVSDPNQKILYANPAFEELTGFSAREVVGLYAYEIGAAAGIHAQEISESITNTLRRQSIWQGEVISRHKDGSTYEALLTVTACRDHEGKVRCYVSSHRSISKHEKLNKARRMFVTNVSHQFRTPLTNISLYLHLLKKAEEVPLTNRYLEVLENETQRLKDLVQDFIALAQLDSGHVLDRWEPVSIQSLVDYLIVSVTDRALARKLNLLCVHQVGKNTLINADPIKLNQALGELLDNALKFSPPGGTITVNTRSVTHPHPGVVVEVQDTGPGIPKNEQDQIFDRFFRGQPALAGNIPGTGLGLCIAQEIAHAHGGEIFLDSQTGVGSTLTFWLPNIQ